MVENEFRTSAKVWLYPGRAAWHFVSIPEEVCDEINDRYGLMKRGWGSLPVVITIGKTIWKTSIFPDKQTGSYVLPLKADVRKREDIRVGDTINFVLKIDSGQNFQS